MHPRLVVNTDDLTSFIYSSSFRIERIWNIQSAKIPAFRLEPVELAVAVVIKADDENSWECY